MAFKTVTNQQQSQVQHGTTVVLPEGANANQQQAQPDQSNNAQQSDVQMQTPSQAQVSQQTQQQQNSQTPTPPAGNQQQATPGKDETVVIGNRKFNTVDEALQFLEGLNQPQQSAQPQVPVVPIDQVAQYIGQQGNVQKQQPQEDDDEYFDKPQEWVKKQINSAVTKARDEVNQQLEQERANQEAYEFIYGRHPDLASKQELVDIVTSQHMSEITKLPSKAERADLIAFRVRQRLKSWGVQPSQVQNLEQTPDVNMPSGNGAGVTPQENDEQPLSFADQMRNHQKRVGLYHG